MRLALVEVPLDHPLVWTEQLMPVMPLVRVRSCDEGIDLAVEAEHGFGHTASMWSRNIDKLSRMARDRLLDLRQERAKPGRPRLRRRRLHQLQHRQPHRRGPDLRPHLQPHPPLHAGRSFSHCLKRKLGRSRHDQLDLHSKLPKH